MEECFDCRLCQTRIKYVYGEGNINSKIMFIGEAPGADENISGRPFIGQAGKLLRKILKEINFNNFYITNIVKCRPPENRDPHQDEFDACKHYLMHEINTINPQIIIILGGIAAKYLLKINKSVLKMRKEVYDIDYIKTYVTYHPAAALYNPSYLKPIKEDLKRIINERTINII